jgi:hypothetical protein
MGPLLLLVRPAAEQYCDFLESTAGAAWRCSSSCEAELLFHCDGAPTLYGEYVWQWLNAAYSGNCIGHQGSFACPPLLLDLTSLIFFLVGTSDGTHYVVPPWTIEYLVQAAVAVVNGNIIRHI